MNEQRFDYRDGARWLAAGVLAVLSAAAQAGTDDHGHPALDGGALYHQYCSVCHGDRGDGRSRARGSLVPPPRDFTTPEAAAQLTRERMVAAVTDGITGTAMAGWKDQLEPGQIEALVDFVRGSLMRPSPASEDGRGKGIYAEYCSVCHGERGDGRSRASGSLIPPPRDFTSAAAARELTRERMIASVTYGRADTAMSPWQTQLDTGDIEATVDFIRNAFMPAPPADAGGHGQGHVHSAPTGDLATFMAAPYPAGLRADAAWGGRFYGDNCAECHGLEGDGQGPRAYFILPKPRDFRHPAARAALNRPHLFEAIAKGSVGTEMAAWDKVLTRHEIASVAEHVFRAFIRPGHRSDTSASADPAEGHAQHDHDH